MRSRRVLVLSVIGVLACPGLIHAQAGPVALSASQVAAACAPSLAATPSPQRALRILGAQNSEPRNLYGPRDLVVVSGGVQAGVQLGQEYFVRRTFVFGEYSAGRPKTTHTAGWLRIVAVNDTTAIALVDTVCDGVLAGDYLEPFVVPEASAASLRPGTPANLDFSSLGRVMFGDEERRIGAAGDFMLIDRFSGRSAPGTHIALYRDLQIPGLPLAAIGDGVIVSITNGTPLMRIISARDAIRSGDYAVPNK